jgi:hypothetical protein
MKFVEVKDEERRDEFPWKTVGEIPAGTVFYDDCGDLCVRPVDRTYWGASRVPVSYLALAADGLKTGFAYVQLENQRTNGFRLAPAGITLRLEND